MSHSNFSTKFNPNQVIKIPLLLSSLITVSLFRITNWPIVDLVGVRNYRNYSDFLSIMELNKYSFNDWRKVKPESVHYGDAAWYISKLLGNHPTLINLFIWIFQAAFVYAFLSMFRKRFTLFLSVSIILVLPPISFVLQRANFDTLFLLVIYAAARLRHRPVLASILIGSISLIKFYPALLILLFLKRGNSRQINFGVATVFVSTSVLIFRDVLNSNPPRQGSVQFGVQTLGYYFAVFLQRITNGSYWYSPTGWYLVGLASLAGIYIFAAFFIYSNHMRINNQMKEFNWSTLDFKTKLFTATFLICFFGGLNFDYRLIFTLPVLFHFSLKRRANFRPHVGFGLLLIANCLSGAIWVPLQFIGDLVLYFWVALFVHSNREFIRVCRELMRKRFN